MKIIERTLTFDIEAGNSLNINGEEIIFEKPGLVKIKRSTRFMLGKQMIEKEKADTPEKLLYWLIQQAYIGEIEHREHYFENAKKQINNLQHWEIASVLNQITDHLELENYYQALKLCAEVIYYKMEVDECGEKPHSDCWFSQNIAEQLIAGKGKLDSADFEFPCEQCRNWIENLMEVKNKFVCASV